MVDTNTDPFLLDYPIPSNDDSIKSIKLILEYISDSIFEIIGNKIKEDIESEKSEDNSKKKPNEGLEKN